MSRTSISSTQTDSGSPLDQALMDAIRGNDDDHEARIVALEDPSIRFFSHFNLRHGITSDLIVDTTVTNRTREFEQALHAQWDSGVFTLLNMQGQVDEATDQHFLRFVNSASSAGTGRLRCMMAWQYSNRTAPATMELRMQMSSYSNQLIRIGLLDWGVSNNIATNPNSGIYVETTGSNWIFKCRNNGGTISSSSAFAPPAAGTPFNLKILHETSGGSEQCQVLTDSGSGYVQKAVLTTNLPTARKIYPQIQVSSSTTDTLDLDWFLFSFGGVLADNL